MQKKERKYKPVNQKTSEWSEPKIANFLSKKNENLNEKNLTKIVCAINKKRLTCASKAKPIIIKLILLT